VDVIAILAFGSRRKSFSMRVFLLFESRNNSYPCIWLSLSSADLVLNMKFSHELAIGLDSGLYLSFLTLVIL
jgi:hypothetical protein